MALLEDALRTRILATDAQQLLGGLSKGRVYPLVLPQAPGLPAVTYQRISTVRDRTSDGPSGLIFARVQFDCWAGTHGSALAAARAVRTGLDGYVGQVDGVDLQSVDVDEDRDDYFDDVKLFRVSVDASVWFSDESA